MISLIPLTSLTSRGGCVSLRVSTNPILPRFAVCRAQNPGAKSIYCDCPRILWSKCGGANCGRRGKGGVLVWLDVKVSLQLTGSPMFFARETHFVTRTTRDPTK